LHSGNGIEPVIHTSKGSVFLFAKLFRALLLTVTLAVTANAQVQDTINKKSTLFLGKDALLLGAFAIGTAVVAPIDMRVASRLQDSATQENRFLSKTATGFRVLGNPGSFIAGTSLYLIGRADRNRRIQSLGLHGVESIMVANVVGVTIKLLAGRQRPYVDTKVPDSFQLFRGFSGEQFRSFPSGHTITAFAFASTVTRESQFWWPHATWYVGTAFYGGASLVGLSRIYNNQHWASDVMAGAAIGTLVGLKVVKYTHSHPGNRIDRELIRGKRSSQIQATPILFSIQF